MIKIQQQWQEKFFCNSHPGTEAVVFCEECSAIPGCSGYWCRECDKKMHEMFPAHKRTELRPFEKKAEMCFQDLRNSLKTLSEHRDKISFERDDDANSDSLERQKEEAQSAIHSAFNQMRELLDQRE